MMEYKYYDKFLDLNGLITLTPTIDFVCLFDFQMRLFIAEISLIIKNPGKIVFCK